MEYMIHVNTVVDSGINTEATSTLPFSESRECKQNVRLFSATGKFTKYRINVVLVHVYRSVPSKHPPNPFLMNLWFTCI